jgi:hypothetical protein
MALGREVHHRPRAVFRQQAVDQRAVPDVALHEGVPGVALQGGQVLEVARVGQGVEVDDGLIGLAQPVQHEVAADEAGAAGDQDRHVVVVDGLRPTS